jgi:hypothetical protein
MQNVIDHPDWKERGEAPAATSASSRSYKYNGVNLSRIVIRQRAMHAKRISDVP